MLRSGAAKVPFRGAGRVTRVNDRSKRAMRDLSGRRNKASISIKIFWLCTALCAWPSLARATQESDALIDLGLGMRRQGDEEGASREFRKAYEISSTPRALAELGLSETALGRWTDAEAHLRQAVSAVSDP